VNLPNWLSKEAALNGLQSTDLPPWHIVVTYDQFDEDGDNIRSGVYEEYWVGPRKYKRIYKRDNLNQTDYATAEGLYRQGDQKWPDRAQSQVRAEIIAPFSSAAALEGFHGRNAERTFSGYKLQCVLIEKDPPVSDIVLNLAVPSCVTTVGGVGSKQSTTESCRFRGVTSRGRRMSRMAASHT
jgi:hypothetical protein